MRIEYKKGGKSKRDPRLARAGVSGYNKPKRTPNHPKKSHIVVAKEGDKVKTIRFGQQGAKTAGNFLTKVLRYALGFSPAWAAALDRSGTKRPNGIRFRNTSGVTR